MMPILSAMEKRFEGSAKPHLWRNSSKKAPFLTGLQEELASPYRRASLLRHGKRADSAGLRGVPPFAVNTSMKMGM